MFAQNAEDVTIYVPQVTGTGVNPDDNTALTEILTRELASRNMVIKETQEEADYALIGMLFPSDADSVTNILSLALQNKNGVILYEQTLFYTTLEEANVYISTVLLTMLSNIFILHVIVPVDRIVYVEKTVESVELVEDGDSWRNRMWYIGANVFWNPRIYYGTKGEFFPFNFGWGISAEFNLHKYGVGELKYLKYLAFGTGLEFASDWVVASTRSNDDYRNTIMQIPLTVYGVFKPGAIFLHEPYLGILFNIPFLPDTVPPVVSWKAGFQYGIKAGKGVFYGDIRFSMDFGKSGFNANRPGDTRQYDRYMIYLGMGYKYDLVKIIEVTANFIKEKIHNIKASKSAPAPAEEATAEPAVETAVEEAVVEAEVEAVWEEAGGEAEGEAVGEEAGGEAGGEAVVEEAGGEAEVEAVEEEAGGEAEVESVGEEASDEAEVEAVGEEAGGEAEVEAVGEETGGEAEVEAAGEEAGGEAEGEAVGESPDE
jgi:hypothetical protein